MIIYSPLVMDLTRLAQCFTEKIFLNGKVENERLIQLEVAKNKLQKACSGSILKI